MSFKMLLVGAQARCMLLRSSNFIFGRSVVFRSNVMEFKLAIPRRIGKERKGFKPSLCLKSIAKNSVSGLLLFSLFPDVKCDSSSFPTIINDIDNTSEETREEYLLNQSERERAGNLKRRITINCSLLRKTLDIVYSVYDSITIVIRLMHLAVIFMPVIAGSPIMLFGKRHLELHNERTGAILWYKLLVTNMELAGPTFIKLGQWAASRTDMFPRQMCVELSKLHSNVKAHKLSFTKKEIEKAFNGTKFEDIFDEFINEPLGIGAIAQVYKAKLSKHLLEKLPEKERNDGWVAVKVLHPNVESSVHRDLQIMKFFAAAIDIIPTMEWLSLPDEVKMFDQMMKLQMDLRIESTNLSIFRENFMSRSRVHFPVSYSSLIPNNSSRRVLVEEYIPAVPMNKLLSLPAENRLSIEEDVADVVLNAFLNMLLIDNFVHADLHPGNIMVRLVKVPKFQDSFRHQTGTSSLVWGKNISYDVEDTNKVTSDLMAISDPKEFRRHLSQLSEAGYKPEVVFLDAGLVTELNATNRKNFIDLFTAIAEFDGYRAGELMVQRSRTPETVIEPEVFALRIQHLVLAVKAKTFTLGKIKIGDILNEVLTMVQRYHVRMEGDFVNVVLSILLLEGIGRQLDPNLDFLSRSLPILRRLGAQSSSNVLKDQSLAPMLKVWVALEAREFVTGSAQDIVRLVHYDRLCPNI
ncbi:ABC1 family-domain-containing protein [Dipodascopsis uninucleata]